MPPDSHEPACLNRIPTDCDDRAGTSFATATGASWPVSQLRVRRKALAALPTPARGRPVTLSRPLDGYVRVSRVGGRGGESFVSPDLQEERIRSYARSRGVEVGTIYRELDRSGADEHRPLFLKALARVGEQSGGIMVANIDRFARSALDALNAIQRIEEAGGIFISVDEGFDSSTAFGRAMMTILLALAELELARVRDVWDAAQARAVARGIHAPPQTPAGYRRRPGGRLEPDPQLAPLIVEAFRRRSEGATYEAIAAWLSEEAAESRPGGFRRAGVAKMLKSRVYLGEAHYGRHRNPAAHPAIVSLPLWLTAQSTAPTHFWHPAAETLLSGLVRCAGCSHLLASSSTRCGPSEERTARLVSYGCRRDRKTELCSRPARASAWELEALVVERFFVLLGTRRRRNSGKSDLEQAEAKLAVVDAKLACLLPEGAGHESSGCDEEMLRALCAEKKEATANMQLALRRSDFAALPTATVLQRRWSKMTAKEQRRMLGAAFDAIFVERGEGELSSRVHFVAAGALQHGFPRQGRPAPISAWQTASPRRSSTTHAVVDPVGSEP